MDERTLKNKGRTHLKQYMPKKSTKWGIKLFAACDVKSAYLLDFDAYTGQSVPRQAEVGLTQVVVERLCEPYYDLGHVIFTDNYYTSPSLTKSLLSHGTHLVSTVRTNRTGFAKSLKESKDPDCSITPRGQCNMLVTTNRVRLVERQESCRMLSTYHRATDRVPTARNIKVNK